jgi:hypothetical protein
MNDISAAIAAARTDAHLDTIVKALNAAWAKGDLGDDDFSRLYGQAHRRRADLRGGAPGQSGLPLQGGQAVAPLRRSIFPERKPQRSPDRRRSIERRRRLAASGPLPPALACMFTTGEQAVLRIVADEVRDRGACECSIDEVAARAGVCRTLVKRTLRMASRHGLLRVTERPRPGKRHDTNLVEITSAEWTAWLRRGPKRIGVTFAAPTANRGFKRVGPSCESHRPESERGRNGSEREPAGSPRAPDRDSHEALARPSSANLGRGRVD